MRSRKGLTAKRLREVLDYNRRTGQFTWRITKAAPGVREGNVAGSIYPSGYRVIVIDHVKHRAARLAILWMTGRWPRRIVDHKNRIRDDDRWRNLREATRSQNGGNMKDRESTAPLKGAYLHKGKYDARIVVNYKTIYLGRFDRAEDAHAAYMVAAKRYFREFARAQ